MATYLAKAPKSNTSYKVIKKANAVIDGGLLFSMSNYLKLVNYRGTTKLGYGDGYLYPHDNLEASELKLCISRCDVLGGIGDVFGFVDGFD